MNFKVGDKVKPKEDMQKYFLPIEFQGKILTVQLVDGAHIKVEQDTDFWSASHFELIKQKRIKNLPSWF
jgi:hypothetical protein